MIPIFVLGGSKAGTEQQDGARSELKEERHQLINETDSGLWRRFDRVVVKFLRQPNFGGALKIGGVGLAICTLPEKS